MNNSFMQDYCSSAPPLTERYHQPQKAASFCNSESESSNQNQLDHVDNCYYCNQVQHGRKTVKKSRERQYSRDLDICRTKSAPGSCPICPIRELCKTTLKYIEKFQKLKKSNSELIALCTKSSEQNKTDENSQAPKQLPETEKPPSIENKNTNAQGDTKDNNRSKKRRRGGESVSKKQKRKAENKEHDSVDKKRQRGGATEPSKKKTVNAEQAKAKHDQTNGKRISTPQSAGKSVPISRQPVNPAIGEMKAQNMRARLEQLDIQRMARCPNGLECSCYPCGPSQCAVQKCCNR